MPAATGSRSTAEPLDRETADRFMAFAFAAADLLVETDINGVIIFAAGAFRTLLGTDSRDYAGRPVSALFRPTDSEELAQFVGLVSLRGRVRPIVLHLADHQASPASVAVRMIPGTALNGGARLSFSIAPLPWGNGGRGVAVLGPQPFARAAEEVLRASGGQLGLVELSGVDGQCGALQHSISALLFENRPGATFGQMTTERYGIVSNSDLNIDGLVARMQSMLRDNPGGARARVAGTSFNLKPTGMALAQAARALRYALGQFAGSGMAAADLAGGCFGLPDIIAKAEERTLAMRETIANRRFRLAFQPVVALSDRKVHHFEALLRPTANGAIGVETTQDFVTFAEAVGLSEELDWAVLTMALEALRATRDVSIAVNMSGLSMQDAAYCTRLVELIGSLGDTLGPRGSKRLLIELTETVEIEDMTTASASIEKLRGAGVPVCLDDLGAGASACRYLRTFGVDYVKIDGVYVRGAETSARDRVFTASMVEIASSVGAEIVAEMIETEAQAGLMRELGVHYGQGWLFGRREQLPGTH